MINRLYWKNKRVLVTGGTGFIGSWLCMTLIELGSDVRVISRSGGSAEGLFQRCSLKTKAGVYVGDIRDKLFVRKCVEDYRPDIVFHLAAQPIFSVANEQPYYTYETNILGTLNVIESAQKANVTKIIFITSEHWDGKQVDNISVYASSKACSEIVIKSLDALFEHKNPHMDIFRLINTAGGGDRELSRIIPYCIDCLNNDRPIVLNRPNANMRFVYILDALVLMLQIAQECLYANTWNISDLINDIEYTTVGLVKESILKAFQKNLTIDSITAKNVGVRNITIRDISLQIVSTQLSDAIADSVYIGKMINQHTISSDDIYDICNRIIKGYFRCVFQ